MDRPELQSWVALNEAVTKLHTVAACEELLQAEAKGKARKNFLMRIQSRLNRVRALEELEQIKKIAKPR